MWKGSNAAKEYQDNTRYTSGPRNQAEGVKNLEKLTADRAELRPGLKTLTGQAWCQAQVHIWFRVR